ncbi:hypothetical protein Syun_027221 [Stephania yunnanensis]|uniref:Uncharacterized protein n=1 Tax=Stephania yunnanensis TaxID=152371 RepID=A0AAP0HR35_9MAGN
MQNSVFTCSDQLPKDLFQVTHCTDDEELRNDQLTKLRDRFMYTTYQSQLIVHRDACGEVSHKCDRVMHFSPHLSCLRICASTISQIFGLICDFPLIQLLLDFLGIRGDLTNLKEGLGNSGIHFVSVTEQQGRNSAGPRADGDGQRKGPVISDFLRGLCGAVPSLHNCDVVSNNDEFETNADDDGEDCGDEDDELTSSSNSGSKNEITLDTDEIDMRPAPEAHRCIEDGVYEGWVEIRFGSLGAEDRVLL